MENTLNGILGKPTDYKICKACNTINWYEKTECHNCRNKEFNETQKKVIEIVLSRIESYEEDGFSESEADEILTDI